MSVSDVNGLRAELERDPDLRGRLAAARSRDEAAAIAAEAGFPLEPAEMPASGELTDDDLDVVTGGELSGANTFSGWVSCQTPQ